MASESNLYPLELPCITVNQHSCSPNYSDITFRLFPKDNDIKNKIQVVRQDKEDFKLEVSLGLF